MSQLRLHGTAKETGSGRNDLDASFQIDDKDVSQSGTSFSTLNASTRTCDTSTTSMAAATMMATEAGVAPIDDINILLYVL